MYKYIVIFVLSLASSLVYSQEPILKIISKENNTFLENVLIYNENKFIGQTDSIGQVKINDKFKILKIVKESFEDIELTPEELNNLNWTIELEPLNITELDSINIIVSREDPLIILNKIKGSRFKQSIKTPAYYQSKVLYECENEILFYFNNVIFVSEDLKVNNNNKIIYNGYKKTLTDNNHYEVFEVLGNECQIPVITSIYCSLGEFQLSSIFEGKLYKYTLFLFDNNYILKFLPKKLNSNLLYEGYFIIDKDDFGILELNISLSKSNNNIWKTNSYDLKTKYEYSINEDNFVFKYSKINDKYILESSSRNMSCYQLKGNQVGKKFNFNTYNEETINHNGLKFNRFNFLNYKFN